MPEQHPGTQPSARRRLVPALTTLAAWTVAFGVVMVLLTAFGKQLASLPPALRALVISGVLVAVMVNLVMPRLSTTIPRLLAGPPDRTSGGSPPQTEAAPQVDDHQAGSTPVDTVGHPAEPGDTRRPPSAIARTWAAYPVHPPLTHVTIGAYSTATILAIAAASGIAEPETTEGWWLALVIGLAASIPTSASGLADFLTLDRRHPARPAVVRHLLPALSTLPCFGAAIMLGHPSYLEGDIAPVPLTLTIAGFVGLTAAGSAGGRLVFTRGLRVKNR